MADHRLSRTDTGLSPESDPISVLYVDDEETLLDLGKIFLEETAHFRVDILSSAQEALTSPNLLLYDVIVSDYLMPEMDGLAFLKAVRELSVEIPFILFTGRGREEVVIEAINLGVDFYLQKGGEPRSQFMELSHKIRQAVRRKKAERSHRETEKRLSDIIEFLPDPTFAIDRSGKVIAWNRAIEEMTGVLSSEMLGRGEYEYAIPLYGKRRPILIDLVHEPDDVISGYYSEVTRKKGTISAETNLSSPKGNRIITISTACPLYNEAGEVTGAIESIRDITDIRRTNCSLKESESKFRTLVEYSRDGIIIVDFEGEIKFINKAGLSMIEEDSLVGRKNILDYIHHEYAAAISADLKQNVEGIEGMITRYKLVTAKKHEIWVEGHGRKIPHEQSEAILISWRDVSGKVQEEDSLRESEEKFRSFAELQPRIIFEADLDFRVTYINLYGRSHDGSPISDVRKGMSALSYIHPSAHARLKENLSRLITGIPYEPEEYPALRPDGTTFPVRIYSSPISRNGKVIGIRGVVIDISEQKRIETELKESEEKFRALVEQSLDGILILDLNGNLIFTNPRFGEIMGDPRVCEPGKQANFFSYLLAEFREKASGDFQRIQEGNESSLMVYQIATCDERVIWIECTGRKITLAGSPVLLLSVHDITHRKNAEAALLESEQKMSTIFRSSPVALSVVSATDGVFVDVNDTFVRLTGYSRSEVIGATADSLRLFPDAALYDRMISELRSNRAVYGMEMPCRNASGEVSICRFSSGTILMGNKPHIISTIEDITESRNLQSAFEAIIQGVVRTTGIEALGKITESINSWLKADCTMIGEIQPDRETIETLSMILDGAVVSDFTYRLSATPCDKVILEGFCQHSCSLSPIFPENPLFSNFTLRGYIGTSLQNSEGKVIGILCVLFRNPVQPSSDVQKIIEIIAVKAAAEIERTQIEHALSQNRKNLEEAMDIAKMAHWEYDVGKDLFTFNDRFYALYGTTAEREGGYQMSSATYGREFFLPADSHMVAIEVDRDILAPDPDFQSTIEHRIIRRDGEIRHIIVRIRVTKDAQGRTVMTHGVNQDITERKQAEEVIRKANHQLSLLTGITRHDILNKITLVYAMLELMEQKYPDPGLSNQVFSIMRTVEEIQSLIEFTRVYEEIGSHEPQWIHLQSLLSRLVIPESITLSIDLPDLFIFADSMIQKVFFTLLDNSIRHGQKVSHIRVSATEADGNLIIVWEDDGAGVEDDEKEGIFEKGFGKNTGYGLFLAREILSLTDIKISEKGEPGKGARFEMIVPKEAVRRAGSDSTPPDGGMIR